MFFKRLMASSLLAPCSTTADVPMRDSVAPCSTTADVPMRDSVADMPDDSRRANASLVGRCVRRLATAAMAVAILQTIAVAVTTGDMEESQLPQQILARPQVHETSKLLGSPLLIKESMQRPCLRTQKGTTIPKARRTRRVDATLDPALARQARAKKTLVLVEVQLLQHSKRWRKRGPI